MEQGRETLGASFERLDGRIEKIELIFENDIKPDLKAMLERNAQMAQALEQMEKKMEKLDEIDIKLDAVLAAFRIHPCDLDMLMKKVK